MKTFSVVSSISMVLTLTVALLSIVGIAITGLYPGIIVLWLLALVPIASRLYVTKRIRNSNDNHAKYYTTFTIINLLTILVVLWMTFVILHDRVLQDCC
jgi:predicted permease